MNPPPRSLAGTLPYGDRTLPRTPIVYPWRHVWVRAVGVTYGIQPESLEANPPDLLLDNMLELLPALESASAR